MSDPLLAQTCRRVLLLHPGKHAVQHASLTTQFSFCHLHVQHGADPHLYLPGFRVLGFVYSTMGKCSQKQGHV